MGGLSDAQRPRDDPHAKRVGAISLLAPQSTAVAEIVLSPLLGRAPGMS